MICPTLATIHLYTKPPCAICFKKTPSRIRFSITIHEAGKLVGQFISIHEWSGAKSIPERATLMAQTIVADCKLLEGRIVKRLTLNF
jgi:hypothetical protein